MRKRKIPNPALNKTTSLSSEDQNALPKRRRGTSYPVEETLASTVPEVVNSESSSDCKDRRSFWNVRKNSLSSFLFDYFEIKSQSMDKTKINVKCKLCPPHKELLSCVSGNNSNLKIHLESVGINIF